MDNSEIDVSLLLDILDEHGYEIMEALGCGGFATVFKVWSLRYEQEFVAKIIHVSNNDINTLNGCIAEIDSLSKLIHPNVISMYDYFAESQFVILILEYCSGGSLQDTIHEGVRMDEAVFMRLATEIISALDHCHEQMIAHRDIKPANILFDKYGRVKLADFGLSGQFKDIDSSCSMCGSLPYLPPELFKKGALCDLRKADIWSLGVTLYTCYLGKVPWLEGDDVDLKFQICLGNISFPNKADPGIVKLIRSMLKVNPKERASLRKLARKMEHNSTLSYKLRPSIPLSECTSLPIFESKRLTEEHYSSCHLTRAFSERMKGVDKTLCSSTRACSMRTHAVHSILTFNNKYTKKRRIAPLLTLENSLHPF